MKKSLLGLLCVSACCLAGCGKGLTTEEACKFADDNWVTGEAAVKENVECRAVIKCKKATGIFEKAKGEDTDKTEKVTAVASNSIYVATIGQSGYKFSTFAGKLYADMDIDIKEMFDELKLVPADAIKGSATSSMVFNKEGFLISQEEKFDFSVDYKAGGISIKGELAGFEKITYSL